MSKPTIEGGEKNVKAIDAIEKKLNRNISKAMKVAAELLKTEIESTVALSDIEHLHIKDDITVSKLMNKAGEKAITVGPDKTAYRAKFLEFGTENMKARPFMTKAYKNKEKQIEALLSTVISQSING